MTVLMLAAGMVTFLVVAACGGLIARSSGKGVTIENQFQTIHLDPDLKAKIKGRTVFSYR